MSIEYLYVLHFYLLINYYYLLYAWDDLSEVGIPGLTSLWSDCILIVGGGGVNLSTFYLELFSQPKLGIFRGMWYILGETKLLEIPVNYEIG